MPGRSSWMPYAPQGVKGFDDDCQKHIKLIHAFLSKNAGNLPAVCNLQSIAVLSTVSIHFQNYNPETFKFSPPIHILFIIHLNITLLFKPMYLYVHTVYLGTLISNENSLEKEIQRCILAGN